MTIKQWLQANYTPQQLAELQTNKVYRQYVNDSGKTISQVLFTRRLRDLGFERKSKRIGARVVKVYRHTGIKPCPNCSDCGTCNNKRYIIQSS